MAAGSSTAGSAAKPHATANSEESRRTWLRWRRAEGRSAISKGGQEADGNRRLRSQVEKETEGMIGLADKGRGTAGPLPLQAWLSSFSSSGPSGLSTTESYARMTRRLRIRHAPTQPPHPFE